MVNAHYAGQNLEVYVANNWKLQQHSRANKQKELGRYFTIQTLENAIYLTEYIKYNLQYVSKNETAFNITGKM